MDCSLPGSSVHGIFKREYWSGLPFAYSSVNDNIDGETVETVSDGDCSHEIKRRLLLGGKVMTNLDS